MTQRIIILILAIFVISAASANKVQADQSWPELRWLLEDSSSLGSGVTSESYWFNYLYRVNHGLSLRGFLTTGSAKPGLYPAFYFSHPFALAYGPQGWEVGYVNEDSLSSLELAGVRLSKQPAFFVQLLSGDLHLFLNWESADSRADWELQAELPKASYLGLGETDQMIYIRYGRERWSFRAGYEPSDHGYSLAFAQKWQLKTWNPFIRQDFTEVSFYTSDRVKLYANLYRPGKQSQDLVVMLNGFGASKEQLKKDRLAREISSIYDVLALDFRGHGKSGGAFTGTNAEAEDVEAAIKYAGRQGYERVILIGFSMGGTVALKSAALYKDEVSGVITISAPFYIDYDDPNNLIQRLTGVAVESAPFTMGNLSGLRVIPLDFAGDLDLRDQIGAVTQPMLIIHGNQDWLIPVDDAYAISQLSASESKKLVILPESFHSEFVHDETYTEIIQEILTWLRELKGQRDQI